MKYQPVAHDHRAFLKKARKHRGFQAVYDALAVEYAVANEMPAVRSSMTGSDHMPSEYLLLARERANSSHPRYRQPEEFGYDFREWVSPYTKGAHKLGGIALVLQDWSSADALAGSVHCDIQLLGRNPRLLTNRRLAKVLEQVFGLPLAEVYATNAFPFVKSGGISAPLPRADVLAAAAKFLRRELEIVKPTITIALGGHAYAALQYIARDCVRVPHPAARIGGDHAHEDAWRSVLAKRWPVRMPQ